MLTAETQNSSQCNTLPAVSASIRSRSWTSQRTTAMFSQCNWWPHAFTVSFIVQLIYFWNLASSVRFMPAIARGHYS